MNTVLFTDDFERGDLYAELGLMVITSDWRGAVGFMRARESSTLICELSSARAIDVLRAVFGDEELKRNRVVGVAVDPETTATARRMGLEAVVEEGDMDGLAQLMGRVKA